MFIQSLILAATLGQAPQQCQNGQCPRVPAIVQTVGQAIHVGSVPTQAPIVFAPMEKPRPIRDVLAKVWDARPGIVFKKGCQ